MTEAIMLPTPAASSSTSPAQLDSTDKKRPRESTASSALQTPATKKAKAEATNGAIEAKETKGVFCHQCRKRVERYLSCTTNALCKKSYCEGDLRRRYNTAISDVAGDSTEFTPGQQSYEWTCPHCRGICQTDTCRKKAGLEPMGRNWDKPNVEDVKADKEKSKGESKATEETAALPKTPDSSDPKPKAKKPRTSTAASLAKSPNATGLKVSKPKKKELKVIPGKASKSSASLSPPPKLASGPKPHDPTKKQRPSHVFSFSDSSLTDEEMDGQTSKVGESSKTKTKTKKDAKDVVKRPTKKDDGKVKAKAKEVNGKEKTAVKGEKGKGKGKGKGKAKEAIKEGEKKVRAKPVKKPEVVVEPPVFEKVDTRLGRVEAEHRITLREYLCRFRNVLSIPERSLPALDDFDRPPTDASVRLFTGAMLDLIKEDLEEGGADEEIIEIVDKYREELRYFADLARFANAYKQLEEPLDLRLPKITLPSTSGQANATAVRNLLGLPENESLPDWAIDAGPARRTAASRLPSNHEVIRMLLAFAERTLSTPSLRADLVWEAPENEARRVHTRELKKENEDWAKVKKGLMAAALQAKTAAATKTNKEKMSKEAQEHNLRVGLANVNLRAALALRAPRHEPLGVDLDGRVYYCLAQRAIDDDSRAPIGWASGLLVWGVGLPTKSDVPMDEDDLPIMVERWCHFGQSADVKQLVKWIEYRTRKAVEAARKAQTPARAKTPNGKTATPKATPNDKTPNEKPALAGTPTNKQSTLNFGLSSPAKPSSLKRSILEVVIPVTKASRASSEDSMSELSDLSSDEEELLQHLAPAGYTPSAELIEENGKELARKLAEIVEWIEVLEWKGMGEVVK